MKGKKALAFFILLIIAVQLSGSYFTFSSIQDWYPTLIKPFWNPPKWVFAPVWTILYLSIAVSGWVVFIQSTQLSKKAAFRWYGAQLFFNFLWSYLFFYLRCPLLGLVDIFLLIIALYATLHSFYSISKKASLLLVPYFVWVLYAASLNLGIYILNR